MKYWHKVSAGGLVAAYAAGEVSPADVLEDCLDRLDAVNPVINAVIAQDRSAAREAALESEVRWRSGNPIGPLDGVPFTVKDNIVTAQLPTTWGSPIFGKHRGGVDELPVARMIAAGAVLIGKTNVPELTLMGHTDNTLFGPTGNPWNPELTPGGSSGGAAAAVSAGIGPVALATDGGGSIRRPASHTGLVGLKPTPGRIPRHNGLPAILLDFEVVGPIARTVADVVTVARALSGASVRDVASLSLPDMQGLPELKPRRILFAPRFGSHPVDPQISASVAAAARSLADMGHDVTQGELPFDPDEIAFIQETVSQAGLAWLMDQWKASPSAPMLRDAAITGANMRATTLFKALDATARLRRTMSVFFETTDLILTPSAAALPWRKTETHPKFIDSTPVGPRGHAVFTAFANVAALPALALPCGTSIRGVPIGFQIVGPSASDSSLLALGAAYEQAFPWGEYWPLELG